MKIVIEVIPHSDQRYPTAGDWIMHRNGDITIRVSKLSDWREEMLIAYHELREALVCKYRGISEESVNEFDINYEQNRQDGDFSEPGDQVAAPYFLPHQYATRDERLLAADIGVDWTEYTAHVNSL